MDEQYQQQCDYRIQQELEEEEWYYSNRNLIEDIHDVVENQIKGEKNVCA